MGPCVSRILGQFCRRFHNPQPLPMQSPFRVRNKPILRILRACSVVCHTPRFLRASAACASRILARLLLAQRLLPGQRRLEFFSALVLLRVGAHLAWPGAASPGAAPHRVLRVRKESDALSQKTKKHGERPQERTTGGRKPNGEVCGAVLAKIMHAGCTPFVTATTLCGDGYHRRAARCGPKQNATTPRCAVPSC
ncbi:unnamed protein product [Phaeothamnion confervicola]